MKTQTPKEVQAHITSFEADFKNKDDALLERKYYALKNGNKRQALYFQEQRDKLATYYQTGMTYLKKRLEAAKEYEAQKAAKKTALHFKQESDAAEQEARTKKTALAKWIQSGGAPSDFEAAWPVMYQELLQTRTMQKMVESTKKQYTF